MDVGLPPPTRNGETPSQAAHGTCLVLVKTNAAFNLNASPTVALSKHGVGRGKIKPKKLQKFDGDTVTFEGQTSTKKDAPPCQYPEDDKRCLVKDCVFLLDEVVSWVSQGWFDEGLVALSAPQAVSAKPEPHQIGDILWEVNGVLVFTMDDLKGALENAVLEGPSTVDIRFHVSVLSLCFVLSVSTSEKKKRKKN